ncbi:hypothetical protein BDQ17DRAFT_1334968 [Cyathus striatus]|nr:hypothetical protein BDQ17DRAFT_1334968 [Cyathus striatus]
MSYNSLWGKLSFCDIARLLVLEKLTSTDARDAFLLSRRTLRGRPNPLARYRKNKRKYNGDLKSELGIDLEMNDYNVASLHIPYGPRWDARRVEKLVYRTDLGMNSLFNPKNKGRRLHRHPAFFGTIEECMDDCCEHCPEPVDEDEKVLQKEEDMHYIRGRISFMEENPGRQSITGSFNPIDVGEWSEQVYIKPMHKLFAAIARKDLESVKLILDESERDTASAGVLTHSDRKGKAVRLLDYRDHVGRTPLHLAIISDAEDVACELIDRGARIIARLVDGKTSLHLAAERRQEKVVRKLLERSAVNEEEAKKAAGDKDHGKVDVDEGKEEKNEQALKTIGILRMKMVMEQTLADKEGNTSDIPEEVEDVPDVLDVNLPDWDFGFTPLAYAVLFGDLPVMELLLGAGADVKLSMGQTAHVHSAPIHPLTLTLLRNDEELTCKIVERLILAGASSSTADNSLKTIFHRAVLLGRLSIVKKLVKCDLELARRSIALFPSCERDEKRDYAMVATLLAAGAKIEFAEEDLTNAMQALDPTSRTDPVAETCMNQHDDLIELMLALGAPINVEIKDSLQPYNNKFVNKVNGRVARGPYFFLSEVEMSNLRVSLMSRSFQLRRADSETRMVKSLLAPGHRLLSLRLQSAIPQPIMEPKVTVPNSTVRGGPPSSVSDVVSNDVKNRACVIVPAAASELTGWKKYLLALRKDEMEVQRKIDQLNEVREWAKWDEVRQRKETKDYFVGVERLLVARGAKTWNELHPDNPMAYADAQLHSSLFGRLSNIEPNPTVVLDPESYRYTYLSNLSSNRFGMSTFIPEHLRGAYDDLFEACYSGDNEKIEQLCLPVKKGAKSPLTLLDIFVTVKLNSDGDYAVTGWTPLFAALAGRRWSTAKLIVAIAAAQYQSDEAEEMKPKKFEVDNYVDSDDECECGRGYEGECEYVTTDELREQQRRQVKRASQSDAGGVPKQIRSKGSIRGWDLQPKAVELAVQIGRDNVDFLDEYIRRTGFGIDVKTQSIDGEEDDGPINANDKNRTYLGLNVHGKKRSDLARKNDPNASNREDELVKPLLWDAIEHNAKAAVEYLSSERPLAAFKFYASSRRGEERAERLRRIPDPQKVLPEMIGCSVAVRSAPKPRAAAATLIGWKTNSLGESPLTAAILGGYVDMIKLLFSKAPTLMEQTLHQNIKFIGYNPILLAVATGRDLAVIDILRSKSVSSAERDLVKGANNGDLLAHLLAKLPREVSEALLVQQSKHCMNTPLLIAVKSGSLRCVKLLLPYAKASLTMRDAAGSIPLHAAVRRGFAEITQLLISAGHPETLYMENAVGNTMLEIASPVDLKGRIPAESSVAFYGYGGRRMQLGMRRNGGTLRYNVSELEHPLDGLWGTILELEGEKKVGKEEKIVHELRRFASTMEERFKVAKEAEDAHQLTKPKQPLNENMKDSVDVLKTFNFVSQAVKENPEFNREIVHLIDVQISVLAALEMRKLKSGEETESYGWYGQHRRYGGRMPRKIIPKEEEKVLGEEEKEEMRERGRSMVFQTS